MDWTWCKEVEQVSGKLSGVPILKGTRVQADLVLDNYDAGLKASEIAQIYTLRLEQVQAVIDFAVSTEATIIKPERRDIQEPGAE